MVSGRYHRDVGTDGGARPEELRGSTSTSTSTSKGTGVLLPLILFGLAFLHGSALAGPAKAQLEIVVGSASGAPGALVEVEVNLVTHATQPSLIVFPVLFDSADLHFLSVQEGAIVGAANKRIVVHHDTPGRLAFLVADKTKASLPLGDGVLVTITFRVSYSAPDGAVLALVGDASANAQDAASNPIPTVVVAGSVSVHAGPPVIEIAVGSTSVPPGRDVELPVTLVTHGGHPSTIQFSLLYDGTKLVFDDAVTGAAASAANKRVQFNGATMGLLYVLIWDNVKQSLTMEDGILLTVEFHLAAVAQSGDSLAVTGDGTENASDPLANEIAAVVVPGTITVQTPPPTYHLDTSVVGEGAVDVSPVADPYDEGVEVTIEAKPAEGWKFDRWEDPMGGYPNPAIVTIESDMAFVAVFVRLPTEDINLDGGVDAIDIQLVINAALDLQEGYDCDVNGDSAVDALDIQLVVNAALGL